ncbi:hypothetical protein [Desulforudis sp. DRI-14]|uniref:hypothetical protein n=1 Tax=Desulforudis sp. DRI-14 TaxID=3459793 RepID=UPI003BDBE11B
MEDPKERSTKINNSPPARLDMDEFARQSMLIQKGSLEKGEVREASLDPKKRI